MTPHRKDAICAAVTFVFAVAVIVTAWVAPEGAFLAGVI